MILLLNTSNLICELILYFDDNYKQQYSWQADRILAKNILSFIKDKLENNKKNWDDINAIGVYKGPGSFTGLRIGITVMNTLANAQNIQIVGVSGDNWQDNAIDMIKKNQDDKIVIPYYGSEAHISVPKK